MKQQILFLHSAGSQDVNEGSSGLLAFLQDSFNGKFELRAPAMPLPQNPQYTLWKSKLKEELENINDQVILIGHSLGGSVLLKYLSEENFTKSIAGLFLVATPYWGKSEWEVEEYMLTEDYFLHLPTIPEIYLYQSMDDEVVSFSHATNYQEQLPQSKLRKLEGRGHEFKTGLPELVQDIFNLEKNTLQKQ